MVRLRGRRRPVTGDEVPHPLPRVTPLQPVQHRARGGLRRARQRARRAARLLVGAAERLDDGGLRRHPDRRLRDHDTAAPARRRGDVLARARRRCRRARRVRPLHDGALGVRPGLRVRLLARHRHLTGGADLPVLHDHGSQDRAGGACRSGRVRVARRDRQHTPDGAADHRVRHQGRPPRRPRRRVRRSSPPRPVAACTPVGRRRLRPVRVAPGDRASQGRRVRRGGASGRAARRRGRRPRCRRRRRRVARPRHARPPSRRRPGPRAPPGRSGDVPHDLRRAGRVRLEPRDRRRGRPAARAGPGGAGLERGVVEAPDHDVGDVREAVGAAQVLGRVRGEGREWILALDPAVGQIARARSAQRDAARARPSGRAANRRGGGCVEQGSGLDGARSSPRA